MDIKFSIAKREHLESIVNLLKNDFLGKNRQDDCIENYNDAWDKIENDVNNNIVIGILNQEVICCAQITYIPGLTYSGKARLQIEGVRVIDSLTGKGVGKLLFDYIEKIARNKNCILLQLTTDKLREEATNFYNKIGYKASHIGMKKKLLQN